jgi:hypothetical protein
VGTAVDKGFDLADRYSRDNHGIRPNVIDVVVSDGGDVLLSAGPLPTLRPHTGHFLLEKITAGIAVCGQVCIAEEFVGLGCEWFGSGAGIGRQYVGDRRAEGPGAAGWLRVICHRVESTC